MRTIRILSVATVLFAAHHPVWASEAYVSQPAGGKAQQAPTGSARTTAVPVTIESAARLMRAAAAMPDPGKANVSMVAQSGSLNSAVLAQIGGANSSYIIQQGSQNSAIVSQRR
ncbi:MULTISPECIES: curlin repeat-containing protein [Rhodopseudomonas]|uniref:Uncharacterized protein n=1 Tax=Rhodopseudomonas palustris (strain DX-1) TaxID=652103 RepID=E6VPA9_RHOPX|nr:MULTISPECIES: curlin repeat-containing protein [Rhodopseudomonas]NEW86070.1 hypothetical protein [Rhodopseudomonas sp. WA056]